jgi:hypothetical protein
MTTSHMRDTARVLGNENAVVTERCRGHRNAAIDGEIFFCPAKCRMPSDDLPSVARHALLSSLADLDDGTGDLGVIVDQAIADDAQVLAADVREIVLAARRDAKVEEGRGRRTPLYVVTVGGLYVGSPTNTCTTSRQIAATWRECDKHDAEALARTIGGQVQAVRS